MFYPELARILLIHDHIIGKWGGLYGVRSYSLLESACYRPRTTFGGEDLYPDVIAKATALAYSLVQNHPFADGNKRTALGVMLVFLYLNNFQFHMSRIKLEQLLLDVAKGAVKYSEFDEKIRKYCDEK